MIHALRSVGIEGILALYDEKDRTEFFLRIGQIGKRRTM